MLRKLNFTDRARIARGAVRIALRRDHDGVLAFEPSLDLDGIAAPRDARIYIEAQYRTSYMRFDCGTMAAPLLPAGARLEEIDSERVVRFRVKVVDNSAGQHRIVAASNDITVACESGGTASRLSLLPVNFDDLGDQVWRVHFEAGQPVLELNNRVDSIERLARNDPSFFALVYPAAVREILRYYLIIERSEAGDEDEFSQLWIRWARELIDEPLPSDRDDRLAWIEEVVAAFCALHRVVEKMLAAEETA